MAGTEAWIARYSLLSFNKKINKKIYGRQRYESKFGVNQID